MATVRLRDAYTDVKRLAARGAKPEQISFLTGVGIDAIYDHWNEFTDRRAPRGPTRVGAVALEKEQGHANAVLALALRLLQIERDISAVDHVVRTCELYDTIIAPLRIHQGKPVFGMPECIELVLALRSGAIFVVDCQCQRGQLFMTRSLLERRRCVAGRRSADACGLRSRPEPGTRGSKCIEAEEHQALPAPSAAGTQA